MDYQHPAIEQLFLGLEEGIFKAVDYMKSEYSLVRPGRANPKLLERIYVDYYGTNTPVHQMSNISSPEPRQLVITLWDKSMLGKVEKAILAASEEELCAVPGMNIRVARALREAAERGEIG